MKELVSYSSIGLAERKLHQKRISRDSSTISTSTRSITALLMILVTGLTRLIKVYFLKVKPHYSEKKFYNGLETEIGIRSFMKKIQPTLQV